MQALESIKSRLLDLAVHGKITQQLEDEPAISSTWDTPKNVPFNIPKNWKWARMSDVLELLTDGEHKTPKYQTQGVPFLSVKNISSGFIDFSNTKFISQLDFELFKKRCNPRAGDILLSKVGTTGVPAIVSENKDIALFVSVALLKLNKAFVRSDFLYYQILSPLVQRQAKENTRGVGNKNWVLKEIAKTLIVVPPLNEQKRIAEKLDTLFSKIDAIQRSMNEVSQLSEFLEKQLLRSAVKGQLAPQLDEEPEVEQIGVAPDDVPFEVPKKWKWGRLSDYGSIVGGGTPSTSVGEYWDGEIPWVTPADLGKIQSAWIDRGAKSITKLGLEKSSAKKMPAGSIVYSSRAPIGRVAIAKNELCTSQGCKSFVPDPTLVDSKYAYFALTALTPEIIARASGTTFKEISGKQFGKTLIPVPPLGEQRRIVEKLDKLMLEIQKLK